jgi:hypothetical protein
VFHTTRSDPAALDLVLRGMTEVVNIRGNENKARNMEKKLTSVLGIEPQSHQTKI